MRQVLFVAVGCVLAGLMACQSDEPTAPMTGAESSPNDVQVAPGPIQTCNCDPFNPNQATILSWNCSPLVPTGVTCIEVNVGLIGGVEEVMCVYWKQRKTQYKQTCTVTYKCNGSSISCQSPPFSQCVWQSETIATQIGPCGDNPFAGEDTCNPLPPCPP